MTTQGYTRYRALRGRPASRQDRLVTGTRSQAKRASYEGSGEHRRRHPCLRGQSAYDMWRVLWQNESRLVIQSSARSSKAISKSGWRWSQLMASLRRLQNHVPIKIIISRELSRADEVARFCMYANLFWSGLSVVYCRNCAYRWASLIDAARGRDGGANPVCRAHRGSVSTAYFPKTPLLG